MLLCQVVARIQFENQNVIYAWFTPSLESKKFKNCANIKFGTRVFNHLDIEPHEKKKQSN